MTVKEYNKIYSEVDTCKVVVDKLDEILRDGDIARLRSLVPDNFTQIVREAIDMYLIQAKLQINSSVSEILALLEEAAETIENCYGRETELSEKIRKALGG